MAEIILEEAALKTNDNKAEILLASDTNSNKTVIAFFEDQNSQSDLVVWEAHILLNKVLVSSGIIKSTNFIPENSEYYSSEIKAGAVIKQLTPIGTRYLFNFDGTTLRELYFRNFQNKIDIFEKESRIELNLTSLTFESIPVKSRKIATYNGSVLTTPLGSLNVGAQTINFKGRFFGSKALLLTNVLGSYNEAFENYTVSQISSSPSYVLLSENFRIEFTQSSINYISSNASYEVSNINPNEFLYYAVSGTLFVGVSANKIVFIDEDGATQVSASIPTASGFAIYSQTPVKAQLQVINNKIITDDFEIDVQSKTINSANSWNGNYLFYCQEVLNGSFIDLKLNTNGIWEVHAQGEKVLEVLNNPFIDVSLKVVKF